MAKMPWILKGHATWVRNRLLRMYTPQQLKDENVWYKEVIEKPEAEFSGISDTDLAQLYEYFSPSVEELQEVESKYGNQKPFTVILPHLTDLYQQAYDRALKKRVAQKVFHP